MYLSTYSIALPIRFQIFNQEPHVGSKSLTHKTVIVGEIVVVAAAAAAVVVVVVVVVVVEEEEIVEVLYKIT